MRLIYELFLIFVKEKQAVGVEEVPECMSAHQVVVGITPASFDVEIPEGESHGKTGTEHHQMKIAVTLLCFEEQDVFENAGDGDL